MKIASICFALATIPLAFACSVNSTDSTPGSSSSSGGSSSGGSSSGGSSSGATTATDGGTTTKDAGSTSSKDASTSTDASIQSDCPQGSCAQTCPASTSCTFDCAGGSC